MGIFDGIFNNSTQEDAAAQQKAGINAGMAGGTAAIKTGLDTSRTDIATGLAGANSAIDATKGAIGTATGNANADYAAALAPTTTNLETTQAGQTKYADALGVNGQAGYDRAVQDFHTGPGYDFMINQGMDTALRGANKAGTTASGGTLVDLQKFGQGTANQTFQQYLSNLSPFIGASTANAGTAASIGTAHAGTEMTGAGLLTNTGNVQAGLNFGAGAANASNDVSQADTLANLIWQGETGKGNADANATLAGATANGNVMNAIMGGAGLAAKLLPFL